MAQLARERRNARDTATLAQRSRALCRSKFSKINKKTPN